MSSNLIEKLYLLPDDIIHIYIWPHISPNIKIWLNKSCYNQYHLCVKNMIPANIYDSYVRNVIRNDDYMVFDKLLLENFDKWIKILKYSYREYIFYNYIFFLSHFAVENNSSNCSNQISFFLKKAGYEKKWHKKNSIKYIRWSN